MAMTKGPNMGPFGNDEEVVKLMKYGIDFDRQRLVAAGVMKPDEKKEADKKIEQNKQQ